MPIEVVYLTTWTYESFRHYAKQDKFLLIVIGRQLSCSNVQLRNPTFDDWILDIIRRIKITNKRKQDKIEPWKAVLAVPK